MIRPQPKPTPRPKKARQPMRRREPMRRTWMRRGPSTTSHGRRRREWGRMAFCRALGCMVVAAFWVEFATDDEVRFLAPGPCRDRAIQAMHLRERPQQHRPPDRRTAGGCEHHHQEIDGKVGGRGPWFAQLDVPRRRRLFDRLVAMVDVLWSALTPEQRAEWDARSTPPRRARGAQ